MSAYRNKPPPPRWRTIYRVPFLERVGRGAVLGGFGVLAMSALLAVCLVAALGDADGGTMVGAAAFAAMVLVTGGTVVVLHWMTSFAGLVECTVGSLRSDPNDGTRCRLRSGEDDWFLPIHHEILREGQTIRVRYRDVAPASTATRGREIMGIEVVED
jgi:hypothetical protein